MNNNYEAIKKVLEEGKGMDKITITPDKAGKYRVIVTVIPEDASYKYLPIISDTLLTVKKPTGPVTAAEFEEHSKKLNVGKTKTLELELEPRDGDYDKIVWKLKDKDEKSATLKVEPDKMSAKLVGVAEGDVTVTATVIDDGKELAQAKTKITVTDGSGKLEKIDIKADKKVLRKGDQYQLRVKYEPEDTSDKGVDWSSSAPRIVRIDDNGLVKAMKPGTATITATAKSDSSIKDTVTIKVADFQLNTERLVMQKGTVNSRIKAKVLKNDSIKSASVIEDRYRIIGSVSVEKGDHPAIVIEAKNKTGEAKIKVETEAGYTSRVNVTVQDGKVTTKEVSTSLRLFENNTIIMRTGSDVFFTVTTVPDEISTGEEVKVGTSKSDIANVKYEKKKGKWHIWTKRKAGTCRLGVRAGGVVRVYKLKVKE